MTTWTAGCGCAGTGPVGTRAVVITHRCERHDRRRRPLRRWAPDHRDPLTPEATRAGYRAHLGADHDGTVGLHCRTCARYLRGIADAHARQALTPDELGAAIRDLAEHVTISACRTTGGSHEQPNTGANTKPNDAATSPHSNAPAPASAPNASASNAHG